MSLSLSACTNNLLSVVDIRFLALVRQVIDVRVSLFTG